MTMKHVNYWWAVNMKIYVYIYIMMKGNESTKCLVWNGAVFARVGHEQSQAGHIDTLAGIKLIIKALQRQRCLP